MSEDKYLQYLRIPLYKLFYSNRAKLMTLDIETAEAVSNDYHIDEVRLIIKSLRWAVQQPNFPFDSLLPGLAYSNQDIYLYLVRVLKHLQKMGLDI